MTYSRISGSSKFAARLLIALTMVVAFVSLAAQPAQAQSGDTWKSVAIIGGATAAGAYIGHKVAGPTGTWIGAGIGATAGYAIDRRRRENQYYNRESGYYDPNNGYYGNSVYNGVPYASGAYAGASQYRSNRYSGNTNGRSCSRRTRR
jgi:hypothetical protein